MAEPAYLSDELELTDEQREEAAALAAVPGPAPTVEGLVDRLNHYGRDETVLETARLLTLAGYRRVEEVYWRVAAPRGPRMRRRR